MMCGTTIAAVCGMQNTIIREHRDQRLCISIVEDSLIMCKSLNKGHGFGMYSGTLAEVLAVFSEGMGHEASFTLELPFKNQIYENYSQSKPSNPRD